MKTGDTGSGWKSKYVVLMPEGKFYIFDQEDTPKPKEILELQACSIHYLHDSYFDHPFCFQILINYTKLPPKADAEVLEGNNPTVLRESFNFAAESDQERATWTQFLRYKDLNQLSNNTEKSRV